MKAAKLNGKSILVFVGVIIIILTLLTIPNRIQLYTSFYGENTIRLRKNHQNIELLYPLKYSGKKLGPILEQLHVGRKIYEELLNLEKDKRKQVSLVVVDKTCGPGCGELNGNRIEIEADRFDLLYDNVVNHNQLDHLLFYELGRIYWIFGDKLTCDDEKLNQVVHTGFAIFMRDVIIERMGKKCGQINGFDYWDYLKDRQLEFDYYKKQTEVDFIQLVHLSVVNRDSVEMKATRIFASMLNQLYKGYGEDRFVIEFAKNINECINPGNSNELFSNILNSALSSPTADLRELFINDWKIRIE